MSIPTVEEILTATHKHLGVPTEIIKDTKYRTPKVCQARGVAVIVSRKLTFLSYGGLEDGFGIDRGTLSASSKKAEKAAKKDSELQKQIESIIAEVSGAHNVQAKRGR